MAKVKSFFTVDSSSVQAAPQQKLLEQALLQTAYKSLAILPCPAMYLTAVPHSHSCLHHPTLVQFHRREISNMVAVTVLSSTLF